MAKNIRTTNPIAEPSEIISPVQTCWVGPAAEISVVARELRAASFGTLTQREAIERARAIVLARRNHAADCLVRAIQMAVAAPTDADAEALITSAIRFLSVALRLAA